MSIPTDPGGTFVDVGVVNHDQQGDEVLEVWLREQITVSGGVEEPEPGVFRGVTDFSEFEVGAGLPTGLSRYGANVGELGPTTFAIGEDAEEGNLVTMSGQTAVECVAGIGYDAWDGLIDNDCELLARVFVPSAASLPFARSMIGPAWAMSGITNGTTLFNVADISNDTGSFPTGLRLRVSESGSSYFGGTQPAGVGASQWIWIRVRRIGDDFFVKAWAGALVDEPAPWTAQASGVPGTYEDPTGAIGVLVPRWDDTADPMRCAFMSFTNDPLNYPPLEQVAQSGLPWELRRSVAVNQVADQVVRITDVEPLTGYDVALRYRRGQLYNPGASNTDDPTTWPSISRGEFTTTIDPPVIESAVWSRTSSVSERITLTVTPAAVDPTIRVYRRTGAGEFVAIDTIAGPHGVSVEYVDTTIAGETAYTYAFTTVSGTIESPLSDPVRVWAGPAAIPVFAYQVVLGGGYGIGFTTTNPALQTELEDTYDNNGGVQALTFRAFAAAGLTEVNSGTLVNVPAPELTFFGRLRHRVTAFTVTDYGEYTIEFNITVPESE